MAAGSGISAISKFNEVESLVSETFVMEGFERSGDPALDLLIATTLYRLGYETGRRRLHADIPLLSMLCLEQIELMGYEPEEPKEPVRPNETNLLRQYSRVSVDSVSGKESRVRMILLSGGKTPWGVSIAGLDYESQKDLSDAVNASRESLDRKIEKIASKVQRVKEICCVDPIDLAFMAANRSYILCLERCREDPLYVDSLISRLCTGAPLKNVIGEETEILELDIATLPRVISA